jgi:hypothetical protein
MEEDHHMDPSKDEEFEVPDDLNLGEDEAEEQEERTNLFPLFFLSFPSFFPLLLFVSLLISLLSFGFLFPSLPVATI